MSSVHIASEIKIFKHLLFQLEAARSNFLFRSDVEKNALMNDFGQRRVRGLKQVDDRIFEAHSLAKKADGENRLLARDVLTQKKRTMNESRVWYLDMMDREKKDLLRDHAERVERALSPVLESIKEISQVLSDLSDDLARAEQIESTLEGGEILV